VDPPPAAVNRTDNALIPNHDAGDIPEAGWLAPASIDFDRPEIHDSCGPLVRDDRT
jgi:hypothetical protein